VQQKVCTGDAVVKPGKLYEVQCYVNQCLNVSRMNWRVSSYILIVISKADK